MQYILAFTLTQSVSTSLQMFNKPRTRHEKHSQINLFQGHLQSHCICSVYIFWFISEQKWMLWFPSRREMSLEVSHAICYERNWTFSWLSFLFTPSSRTGNGKHMGYTRPFVLLQKHPSVILICTDYFHTHKKRYK